MSLWLFAEGVMFRVVDPPWRAPGADTTDFFNYGMDENSWKAYCKAIECHRQEFSMKKKIQTYESSNMHFQQDPDLPPEVAAAIAAETYQARSGTGPDMAKALPIPVFQGTDDYSMRNRVRQIPRHRVDMRVCRGVETFADQRYDTIQR